MTVTAQQIKPGAVFQTNTGHIAVILSVNGRSRTKPIGYVTGKALVGTALALLQTSWSGDDGDDDPDPIPEYDLFAQTHNKFFGSLQKLLT